MEEAVFAFGLATLAVGMAMAVFLGMRRRSRDASDEIATLQKKVAALKQRNRQLEQEPPLRGKSASHPFGQKVPGNPRTEPDWHQPVSREAPPNRPAFSEPPQNGEELAMAMERLYALKSVLPEDACLSVEYVVEFGSILDLVELESGANLSRFRISTPCDRSSLRSSILALLGFCEYQVRHPQLPRGFVPAPPGAARLIH